MVSPPLEEAAASAAPLRVEPAPRPLMGSQGRSGSPGNRGPREGEGGEARQLQEARVARGKRGKGKAGTGRGGRGSGAEGKPGLRPARKAAGPAAEAGPGREGEEGGGVEEGPRSSGQRDEGSAGPGAGRREDGSLERARERGWQAWGGVPGTRTAMAAAAEEAAAAAAEPATRPAAGPALWSLPEELLLLICSYLDIRALGRLAQVCRWLRRFTSCDLLWRRIARASLNSGFTRLGTDLMTSIPVKDRVRVSQNWRLGRCRQGTLLKWRCGQMPWMQLKDASLYISQANSILAYQFRPDGASLNRRPFRVFAGHDEDVCHFVLADSHIVSAGGDGKIGVHKLHSTFTIKYSAHEQEVNCVDCKGGIIVSGSRDRTAKVWPLASGRLGQCLHTIQTEDRVWSIAISPLLSGQLITHLGSDFPPGAGVLDVMYESPSTLLSCGYDTYVRYWDLRTSVRKCVMEWEEPHDSTLYCLQTDGNHLLATGSSYYGVVRLWDRRQRACLHAFPLTSTPLSSPVYCLRFTTRHLYAALSYNLHILDFQNP
ncbi:F-box/WD repeat-containing protein 4 isoform X2 [Mesocricetus auratus]|uniref:F-box/WD repeat-containing protein 4 isoform X2 n=1 Tax=Mesocricetus auratus TaxID=10036 RepID=A0A3Q0D6R5_MESAU|nr:F-box/WD repeat-containing protein 4 isoform X2 [Mesocricetus auratus]